MIIVYLVSYRWTQEAVFKEILGTVEQISMVSQR